MWPRRLVVAAVVALVAAACGLATAGTINELSFGDKYDRVDTSGKRVINDDFLYGGTTEVKKSFIRLTTDRQSKRGYIWSRRTINHDQLVSVINFRIHGQGRKWFGDGIGIWLTHEKEFVDGDNHGFTDKYYGVGIVLDTFNNVEHRGGHKDVTVQINDGRKTLDALHDEKKLGCDAAFRYHAGSGSFDPVYSMSRLRIKLSANKLVIHIDPKSEGTWTECYEGELPFSAEWLRQATIGFTATTGALADNHDIIKMISFDDAEDYAISYADSEVWTHNYSKDFDRLMDSSACDQTCKITILSKFISNFHIEAEHWFEELKESTENIVSKLQEQERLNHLRILTLTQQMHEMVETRVGAKIADVKTQAQQKISSRVEGELVATTSGWRLPFFIIVVLLAAAVGFAYQKYQKLVKSHFL